MGEQEDFKSTGNRLATMAIVRPSTGYQHIVRMSNGILGEQEEGSKSAAKEKKCPHGNCCSRSVMCGIYEIIVQFVNRNTA